MQAMNTNNYFHCEETALNCSPNKKFDVCAHIRHVNCKKKRIMGVKPLIWFRPACL